MEKMQWEKVLGDTVGQPVSFDEFSLTAVMFEEPKMIVNLELRVNELVIYALVGELIEERQMRGLLEGNCLWNSTNGATLSLLDEKRVLLAMSVSHQDQLRFSELLSGFVDAASYWQQKLLEAEPATVDAQDMSGFSSSRSSLFV
ncbi:type III secretion system chaperone [Vibrio diabolicus]|uniref:type III secretion system chaperone n=1 Tax=Vibrio diabolicus TaxID=50719 RepID=UPI00215FC655|nr:type III secretion system chaperone [Vibrio diabolicus]MCS0419374.1 type III secretion system chaperone [Vibrio diabolicus]